jgi:MOSC domain-containing protein YiiM
MVSANSILAALFSAPMSPGRVIWMGVRPARREPLVTVESMIVEAGKGIVGDRYKTSTNGPRQVTLIQGEDLDAIASYMKRESIDPGLLRRNIVVRGINLLAMKDKRFQIGSALFEYTGECHPCSRMEENLGVGGYNAVRGHGGITARVLDSGKINLGDAIYVPEQATDERE